MLKCSIGALCNRRLNDVPFFITVPPNAKDDEFATMHFQREFRSRFGPACPNFFTGSLQNAVAAASGTSVDDEKLLGE